MEGPERRPPWLARASIHAASRAHEARASASRRIVERRRSSPTASPWTRSSPHAIGVDRSTCGRRPHDSRDSRARSGQAATELAPCQCGRAPRRSFSRSTNTGPLFMLPSPPQVGLHRPVHGGCTRRPLVTGNFVGRRLSRRGLGRHQLGDLRRGLMNRSCRHSPLMTWPKRSNDLPLKRASCICENGR